MPADGGEGHQLTSAPKGVQDFSWSPDSSRIVYCADTEPAAGAAASKTADGPRVVEVNRLRYRHDLQGWRGDALYHLFVIKLGSGVVAQLTHGDWDDFGAAWSPDGGSIAFVSGRRDDRDSRALTEAYVVPAEAARRSAGRAAWPAWARWPGRPTPAAWRPWPPTTRRGWYSGKGGLRPATGRRTQTHHRRQTASRPRRRPRRGAAAGNPLDCRGRILFLGEHRGQSFICQTSPAGGRDAPTLGRRTPGLRAFHRRQGSQGRGLLQLPRLSGGHPGGGACRRRIERRHRPQFGVPGPAASGVNGKVQFSAGRVSDRMQAVVPARL